MDSQSNNLQYLYQLYEKEKAISLKMRKILSNFINLEVYDSIEYVFYYNNQRYVTNHIDASWLIQKGKGSELSLDLERAAEELQKQYQNTATATVQKIFNEHYLSYLSVIQNTMKNKTSKKINKGHIAEAFESHLAEHHTSAYNLLNTLSIQSRPLSTSEKIILSKNEEKELHESNWKTHDGITMAWQHIRGALGTQRGTVAGDVGKFQVKQGTNFSQFSSHVRLSSLTNLKTGISRYCEIFSEEEPEKVARKIAMYLSEPVKKTQENLNAYIMNKEIATELNKIEKLRHI